MLSLWPLLKSIILDHVLKLLNRTQVQTDIAPPPMYVPPPLLPRTDRCCPLPSNPTACVPANRPSPSAAPLWMEAVHAFAVLDCTGVVFGVPSTTVWNGKVHVEVSNTFNTARPASHFELVIKVKTYEGGPLAAIRNAFGNTSCNRSSKQKNI
jgi:hypothetical protein